MLTPLIMDTILRKLECGDRRSIGRVDEVVTAVIKNPALFKEPIAGLFVEDPVVRMRAADVTEKITLDHAQYLQSQKLGKSETG
jgi:hypothetical protein